MERKKILVFESEHVLSAGVISLLSNQEDFQVLARLFTASDEMVDAIEAFQPDVMVMDEGSLEESAYALAISLKKYPGLRTIIIHWQDNEIEIYDRQKVLIRELDDFLSVV